MKIIFITSSGRSGSKSIALALDRVKSVKSFHSPFKLENYNCHNYLDNIKDMKLRRARLIKSVRKEGYDYVESANCIRHHLVDLVEDYPDCLIVHLVRDGRDYVRSGFNRPWFQRQHDRFAKICGLWATGQRMTIDSFKKIPEKNRGGVVRLEDLRKGDMRWFIRSLGLRSQAYIKLPAAHVAKTYNMPPWTEWDKKTVREANAIMGVELKHFGYKW